MWRTCIVWYYGISVFTNSFCSDEKRKHVAVVLVDDVNGIQLIAFNCDAHLKNKNNIIIIIVFGVP